MLRLAVAGLAPLSPDEAYYWVWSRALAPGYLDHPPMVALFIRAGTALAGDGALGVRLLSPLAAAVGSLLLADAGRLLCPVRGAGLSAALMLNATLLFASGAVTATPDTPLLLFWTAAIWAIAKFEAGGRPAWWLAAGIATGCAMASKYTGLLLLPAVFVWLILARRACLATLWPWLAAGLAGLVFSPVLLWNATHGWASFAKQGGRVADLDARRAAFHLAELVGGQIGLATPVLAVVFAIGIAAACRRDPPRLLLACLTLLPAAVFVQHATGDRVQANWPAILYPSAALAAGCLGPAWQRWRAIGVAIGVAATLALWLQAIVAPVALPRAFDPTLMRLAGWPGLAERIAAAAARSGAVYVVADNYGLAAILARTLPPSLPVVAAEPRWALFHLPAAAPLLSGPPGLLVRSERRADDVLPVWHAEPVGTVERARGVVAERYRLYRVSPEAAIGPAAILPRPESDDGPADP